MTLQVTHKWTELANRSSGGIDVTLLWDGHEDKTVVRVCDRRHGESFEILTESYLAYDVYTHPFVYRDFSQLAT